MNTAPPLLRPVVPGREQDVGHVVGLTAADRVSMSESLIRPPAMKTSQVISSLPTFAAIDGHPHHGAQLRQSGTIEVGHAVETEELAHSHQ